MKLVRKISLKVNFGKIVSAVTMIFLLLFMTTVNQFVYGASQGTEVSCNCEEDNSNPSLPNSPAGPDEKSPDAPVSINEELIHFHEIHTSPFWTNALFTHLIHEAGKLCVVHLEYQTPPPNA
jgi:hypothetical protein